MASTSAERGADHTDGAPMSREWHWHPPLPIPDSPVFRWPPQPVAAFRWLAASRLAVSMIVLELATACAVWFWLQPSPDRTATLALDGPEWWSRKARQVLQERAAGIGDAGHLDPGLNRRLRDAVLGGPDTPKSEFGK